MVKIHLIAMHCMLNEESDKDEVFLKHDGKKYGRLKGSTMLWPQTNALSLM